MEFEGQIPFIELFCALPRKFVQQKDKISGGIICQAT